MKVIHSLYQIIINIDITYVEYSLYYNNLHINFI
jgi:hypothetical protein